MASFNQSSRGKYDHMTFNMGGEPDQASNNTINEQSSQMEDTLSHLESRRTTQKDTMKRGYNTGYAAMGGNETDYSRTGGQVADFGAISQQ